MDEQARYEDAKKRVTEIRDFYQHFSVYLVVNAALVALNLLTSPGYFWFVWPLFGWGIGVAFHALSVFGGFWGRSWEDRKIKEIMDRDRRADGS
jgi:uncharacterized membrane protein